MDEQEVRIYLLTFFRNLNRLRSHVVLLVKITAQLRILVNTTHCSGDQSGSQCKMSTGTTIVHSSWQLVQFFIVVVMLLIGVLCSLCLSDLVL